jgi:hypothetical protein
MTGETLTTYRFIHDLCGVLQKQREEFPADDEDRFANDADSYSDMASNKKSSLRKRLLFFIVRTNCILGG